MSGDGIGFDIGEDLSSGPSALDTMDTMDTADPYSDPSASESYADTIYDDGGDTEAPATSDPFAHEPESPMPPIDDPFPEYTGAGLPPGGIDPTGMAQTSPLWVDPATTSVDLNSPSIVGRPDLQGTYLQYQGEGNAFCGPYSAAMALSVVTGESWSGDDLTNWAVDAGYLTNDGDPTDDTWGGWSGMTTTELDTMLDAQLERYGGSSGLTDGNTTDDLEARLAAGEQVITFVDSAELRDAAPDVDELPGTEGNPNHFLVVTGVDRESGWVLLNDPVKQQPSMMPLEQFEGAWRDSNGTMFSLSTEEAAVTQAADAPVVQQTGAVTESADAVPPAEECGSTSCCVLPVTYDLLAAAPMEVVDGTIVPSSAHGSGQGRSTPSASRCSSGAVRKPTSERMTSDVVVRSTPSVASS